MALMTSLVALSIDAMLPALEQIGSDLGTTHENQRQLVLSMLFFGLAIGQFIYGPISDSVGRKSPIYVGIVLFIIGCLMSTFATTFEFMLAGRFLQGIGAAGPRIVCVAIIRDQYSGNAMARIMSLIMTIFILIPAVAPAIGQGVLLFSGWRAIFVLFLAMAIIMLIWFGLRQPETLPVEKRLPFSMQQLISSVKEVCATRVSFGYTIAGGLIFGAFVGFLFSVQQILQEQYELGEKFPLYFAGLALAIGCSSLLNSKLVMKLGMRRLTRYALVYVCSLSLIYFLFAYTQAGEPSLVTVMAYLTFLFFGIGILFGNINSLAMEPLGHIAGIGSAFIGSAITFISLFLGTVIGQAYNGTVIPMVAGFAILSVGSALVVAWVEIKKG